jgi:hypothetical protein
MTAYESPLSAVQCLKLGQRETWRMFAFCGDRSLTVHALPLAWRFVSTRAHSLLDEAADPFGD